MEKRVPAILPRILPLLQRYRYALLAVLAGVLLLSVRTGDPGAGSARTGPQEPEFDAEEMERKLENTLSSVSGAGKVTVMLSVKEGMRLVLAQNTRATDGEQSQTAVVISQGSGVEQPVKLVSVWPRYQGAVIVCDGADRADVRLALTQAVHVITGLSSERISICKRQ